MRPLLGEFSALTCVCVFVCVCVCVCVFVCLCVCLSALFEKKIIAGGPPAIFSDNKVHTINIIIHFQIKLKNFLGPKILMDVITVGIALCYASMVFRI